MSVPSDFLTASEAASLLEVSVATLYAYVSRGKVRSYPAPGRGRRYARHDIERVRRAALARSGHGPVAGAAMDWGQPVLATSIVEIGEDGPRYRGISAVELARAGRQFESAAELLWTGQLPSVDPVWQPRSKRSRGLGLRRMRSAKPLSLVQLWLPHLALEDGARFVHSEVAELERARGIIPRLVEELASRRGARVRRRALDAGSVAGALLVALGARAPSTRQLAAMNRALVVVADHELNASTFAARVAASTGADLYACLSAAAAALCGPRHGGACERIDALLAEVSSPRAAREVILRRTRRGEAVPGFGHPLYPTGDPRAEPLVSAAKGLGSGARLRGALALARIMAREGREYPTVDFALVVLATALGLPAGSAGAIFAIGRSAGWVAHVIEQRRQGTLLRPRAVFQPGPQA